MDERARIERVLEAVRAAGAPSGGAGVVLGPGDDAALLRAPAGSELAWSTDEQVEGVHFRRAWGERAIGRKATGASLSDLAAMGASPLGALLSLRLPPDVDSVALEGLAAGVGEQLARAACPLVGGNLTQGERLGVGITVLGSVPAGCGLRRDAGMAGDGLYVSGTLGLARAGLKWLESGGAGDAPGWEEALSALLDPRPRLTLGRELVESGLRVACLDLSDGLARDLERLARLSGVSASVASDDLPQPPQDLATRLVARLGDGPDLEPAALAWAGGEDYQLLVAGGPELARFPGLHRIGQLCKGPTGEVFLDGNPVDTGGFDHFRR